MDGIAALADTRALVEAWSGDQAQHLPASLLESARALARFIAPLTQRGSQAGRSGVMGQSLSGPGLFEQLAARMPERVERILVLGAFFDAGFAFLRQLLGHGKEQDGHAHDVGARWSSLYQLTATCRRLS